MPINLMFQPRQYVPDIEGVRGGLKSTKPEDRPAIEALAERIKQLPEPQAKELASKHPGAVELRTAIQNQQWLQRMQQIMRSSITQPQAGFEAAGPPTRQGELPGENGFGRPMQAGFDAPRATMGLLSEGLLTPQAQVQMEAIQQQFAPPKPLTTSNVINTINPKTGKTEIVTVDEAIGRQKAPTVNKNINVEDLLNSVVPAKELGNYRNSENQIPKFGTKYGELEEKGFGFTELAERKQQGAAQAAELLIANLAKTAFSGKTQIFAKEGWFPRIEKTLENAFSQMSQSNVDLETFNSNRRASLSLIIRALGEVGTLNVQDIQRIDEAIPKASGYGIFQGNLVDNQKVAKEKFKKLASFLRDMRNALRKRGQGPTPPGVVEDYINSLEGGSVSEALTAPALPEGWSVKQK